MPVFQDWAEFFGLWQRYKFHLSLIEGEKDENGSAIHATCKRDAPYRNVTFEYDRYWLDDVSEFGLHVLTVHELLHLQWWGMNDFTKALAPSESKRYDDLLEDNIEAVAIWLVRARYPGLKGELYGGNS